MADKKDGLDLAPITRVFTIIDSCINEAQLDTCKKLAVHYCELAREKGVINYEDVKETLDVKIEEKKVELKYIEDFS